MVYEHQLCIKPLGYSTVLSTFSMKPFATMLLNVSNHPFSSWPQQQQIDAQRHYGGVVEIPFPHIEPDWDIPHIMQVCTQLCKQIMELHPQAVYIVGEHVTTFILVRMLQEHGITCLNARSERVVIQQADGTESKRFQYKGFRAYPNI